MSAKHQSSGPSQRQLRVGEELRHALAEILRRGHFRDPDLADVNITVGEVRASPDLKNATAFVMPLGNKDRDKVVIALNRASSYIRGELAREIELRFVPSLTFMADTSLDYARHIDELLQEYVIPTGDAGLDG